MGIIRRVITNEPEGIYVQVETGSGRSTISIELGGSKISINLSRLELLRFIGLLQEGYDTATSKETS